MSSNKVRPWQQGLSLSILAIDSHRPFTLSGRIREDTSHMSYIVIDPIGGDDIEADTLSSAYAIQRFLHRIGRDEAYVVGDN